MDLAEARSWVPNRWAAPWRLGRSRRGKRIDQLGRQRQDAGSGTREGHVARAQGCASAHAGRRVLRNIFVGSRGVSPMIGLTMRESCWYDLAHATGQNLWLATETYAGAAEGPMPGTLCSRALKEERVSWQLRALRCVSGSSDDGFVTCGPGTT
jgi:hypothetical protein